MKVYRQEEGMWARVPLAILGGIITFYMAEAARDWGRGAIGFVWAGLVFAILAAVTIYFAFFHRKTGDVLIDTEGEMRKVVWPRRDEVSGSTIVVIGTVFILGTLIFAMDVVLLNFLRLIGLF